MDKSGSIGNFTPNFLFVKALTDQFKSERTRFAIVLFDEYAQSSSIPNVYLIVFCSWVACHKCARPVGCLTTSLYNRVPRVFISSLAQQAQ
jgi:hypothetical protein